MAALLKICTCLLLMVATSLQNASAEYKIGVGRADVTGPAAEIIFMGYAKTSQKGCGIHLRLYSRAFIIEDKAKRVLFVSVDAGMIGIGLKRKILQRLNKQYGDLYNEQNFILSGTHTHSGPGGYLMDLMFDIPIMGFVQQSFDALVAGITRSIARAHENMVEGNIYVSSGELLDSNINRSPAAYLYNPEAERSKYQHNVDKEMVQLKFISTNNKPIGMISWFAVHPTSMNNTNCLVSSDNVGYASVLMENHVNGRKIPGKGPFVAAFASSNLGDVSPNINGPRCINTGEECDIATSTCNGEAKYCIASGPGKDIFESTQIIASRLFNKAKELWYNENESRIISGPLGAIHKFVDMPKQTAQYTYENGTEIEVKGCLPAMGYSFAAGTTDGPGEFDFTQGTTSTNPLWNAIRDFLGKPTKEDIECHFPKPILLMTGRANYPYPWAPRIVSLQMIQIGDFIIAAVPGEFTTMSGRRLRSTIKDTISSIEGYKNAKVVIAGLSNIYSDYIATPEEYQMQRYEAASTIYGPHTLTIYLKAYKEMTEALVNNKEIGAGPQPHDLTDKVMSFVTPVIFDMPGWNEHFGDCVQQPKPIAKAGDVVVVKFVAGHPRNDLMQEKTFLAVEKLTGDKWLIVATDSNWETRFKWYRPSSITARSIVEIQWEIGEDVEAGTYRIRHVGSYKYIFGGIHPYKGVTNTFKVVG